MFENSTLELREKLVKSQEIMHRNFSQSTLMYIDSIVRLKRKKNMRIPLTTTAHKPPTSPHL